MKLNIRAHPLMALEMIKPFLFVLVLPFIKGAIQYILYKEMNNVLNLEALAIGIVFAIGVLKWKSVSVIADNEQLFVSSGVIIKRSAAIKFEHISSVSTIRSPIDMLCSSVSCRINTEAGRVGKPDFEVKLWVKDAKKLSKTLYGDSNRLRITYSPIRIAAMAATTSSAFTGLIIGGPIIKKAGDLLGLALSDMLFDEINAISKRFNSFFPPAVNIIVAVFMLAYGLSFIISFFKFINFRLFIGDKKLEIKNGFISRKRTIFTKSSINDVCVEQRPLMRIFGLYSVLVTVGGYGDNKSEKAVIVPCGKYKDIKHQLDGYFPMFDDSTEPLRSKKDKISFWRSFFVPRLMFIIILFVSAVLVILFPDFDRFAFFLTAVALAVDIYYCALCFYNYKYGALRLGANAMARGSKGLGTRELYCEKQNLGLIKLIRTPADRRNNTCKVELSVRSESADTVRVRNLDYNSALKTISDNFDIPCIIPETEGNID